jgi:hypothetical protein
LAIMANNLPFKYAEDHNACQLEAVTNLDNDRTGKLSDTRPFVSSERPSGPIGRHASRGLMSAKVLKSSPNRARISSLQ